VGNQILYALPDTGHKDGCVFTRIFLSLVPDLTRINNVGQQTAQRVQGKRTAWPELTCLPRPALQSPAPMLDLGERFERGAMPFKQCKDLSQEFNSLDAQREVAQAFVLSQRREGWVALPEIYDDGGFTGANMDRPALARLLRAVEAGALDCVVVYKVDRLSRSLLDFTKMLSIFEKHNVSFVAVAQQFNTSTSLGRLTLNILLSFAQFKRELIGERTRDKMSAARRKGKWVGGCPVLGYDVSADGGRLIVNEEEAERVNEPSSSSPANRTVRQSLAASLSSPAFCNTIMASQAKFHAGSLN
jgi:DNA invertase Pin-like site-specific DNA recombinase